ncbi:D-alanine--D-alanine ligase [Massilicoli timonensis]|uniref:D-alanine--D-alanine ligase n=1 Tax=Massilicoli timonensis TaxID=2015901 RepID=UPI000C84FF24|nr:D-alanine--D-alanine ligase [Massilicoli timonensis]
MTLQVGIIFGGPSVEHEISILSAMQVLHTMESGPYKPIPIYISKQLDWYCDDALFDLDNYKDLKQLCAKMKPVQLIRQRQELMIVRKKKGLLKEYINIDVVLPVIHGNMGEDGCLQGLLSMYGVPFAGSETAAAAIGQDKWLMKQILEANGIAVLKWRGITVFQDAKQWQSCFDAISYPCIIKPAKLGSSIGIQVASSYEEACQSLQKAFQYDTHVVVEPYLKQVREYNISILGDEEKQEASVVEEVMKNDEILSYHDKYEKGSKSKGMAGLNRIVPAELTDALREQMEAMAKNAFVALRLSGVCRIDFLYDGKQLYINEVNTIPGSLAYYLWEESKVPFRHLIMRLIQIAIRRTRRKDAMITTYDTNILAGNHGGVKK